MECSDKHFNKTKMAILELEESLRELEIASNQSIEINNKLSSKVLVLNKAINQKIVEIDSIINTLNGALK